MSLKYRIAVAVHTYGHVEPKIYFNHIAVISEWAKKYDIVFLGLDKAKVASARNILVDKAKGMNCTHILFLDADHKIDSMLLPYLASNTDSAAVSGLVVKTSEPHEQVGFVNVDNSGLSNAINVPLDGRSYAVDACAFGCTLIDLTVFDSIEKPWFRDTCIRDDSGKLQQVRSDMLFCRELRAMGKMIRVDTRAIIVHLGDSKEYHPADYYSTDNSESPNTPKLANGFQMSIYQKVADEMEANNALSVLDIGCGDGSKINQFAGRLTNDIVGIDIEDVVSKISKSLIGSWVSADLNADVVTLNRTFDVIVSADCIEHILFYNNLLDTIKEHCHKDTIIILSTPESSTTQHQRADHKHMWNKADFLRVLESNGFNILESALVDEMYATPSYKSIVVKCKVKSN